MVDISLSTQGVVGAQLAGAGLGGCMMFLVRKEAITRLVENLELGYYQPQHKPSIVLLCKPIAGSGMLLGDTTS